MSVPDFVIGTMLLLKNNWGLTGSLIGSNITFTTGFYNERLNTPQICVTPLIEPIKVKNIGTTPFHFVQHIAQINVWVKAPTAAGSSLGQAKNDRYRMMAEIRRIIREFPTNVNQFMRYSEISYHELLDVRPPLLNGELRATLYDFRGVESNTYISGSMTLQSTITSVNTPSSGAFISVSIPLTGRLVNNIGLPFSNTTIKIWGGLSNDPSTISSIPIDTAITDTNGNWSKTVSIATRGNDIIVIVAGYNANGPVDPTGIISNFLRFFSIFGGGEGGGGEGSPGGGAQPV